MVLSNLETHLRDVTLKAILRDWSSGETAEPGVVHLVVCERCRQRCLVLEPQKAPLFLQSIADVAVSADDLGEQGLSRLAELVARHEAECERGDHLAQELLRRPAGHERRAFLQAIEPGPEPASLANGIRTLLPALVHDQPSDIIELAGIALDLLAGIRSTLPRTALDIAADLEAQCGNAHRLLSDPRSARRHLKRALELAAESPDRLIQARVAVLVSLLFRDLRCFEPADKLASSALATYRQAGAHLEASRAEFLQATILYYRSDFEAVVPRLTALLRQELDTITRLSVVFSLVRTYLLLDESFRAAVLFPEVRTLTHQLTSGTVRNYLDWLKGLMLGHVRHTARAEDLLMKVKDLFLDRGRLIEAAIVTLDLADIFLSRGRDRDAAEAAGAIVHAFEITERHQEALAALRLYIEADASARRQLGRELQLYLPLAKTDPSFKFAPGCMIRPHER